MLKTRLVVVVVFGLGCGGEKDCDDTRIEGAYYVNYTTLDGDCGDLADGVTVFGGGSGDECTVEHESVSDNGCDVSLSERCEIPEDDLVGEIDLALTTAESGSSVSGTLSMTLRELSTGAFICYGTYRVMLTRQ